LVTGAHTRRALGNRACQQVRLEGRVVEVVEEKDRSTGDQFGSKPFLQFLRIAAAGDGGRLAPEGDQVDAARQQPFAGTGTGQRCGADQHPRGAIETGTRHRRQQRREECGLVGTRIGAGVDQLGIDIRDPRHHGVGIGKSCERLAENAQRPRSVGRCRADRNERRYVGHILEPITGRYGATIRMGTASIKVRTR
jgi:hypothetical protein